MKKRRLTRRKFLIGTGVVALGGAGTVVSQLGERDRLTVERHTLPLPNWDADGFRLGVIADLHMDDDHWEAFAFRAVDTAESEKPDALAVVGDIVSNHDRETAGRIERLGRRLAEFPAPVYVVLGNHEYWTFRVQDVVAMIKRMPVNVLRNQTVEQDGVRIWGLDDAIAGRWRPDDLDERFDRNVVALLHEPDMVEDIPSRVSLQVSGHSHGGQICLPGGYAMRLPRGARKYVRGFYPEANCPVYVNRGLASIGVPYRAFSRPEVSVLTLKSG